MRETVPHKHRAVRRPIARTATELLRRISFALAQFAQTRRQFFINPAEATVGKNRDDVAAAHLGSDGLYDGVGIGEKACAAAIVLDFSGQGWQFEAFIFWNGI